MNLTLFTANDFYLPFLGKKINWDLIFISRPPPSPTEVIYKFYLKNLVDVERNEVDMFNNSHHSTTHENGQF